MLILLFCKPECFSKPAPFQSSLVQNWSLGAKADRSKKAIACAETQAFITYSVRRNWPIGTQLARP